MYLSIKRYLDDLTKEFESIPNSRKIVLNELTQYIAQKKSIGATIDLVYICTHNSRRSHFGQVWACVAANYYKIKNVRTYSGGTQATAFNTNAVNALKRVGFIVKSINAEKNSIYHVFYDDNEAPSICFSKIFDDKLNPKREFVAIMTCSDAEQNCPFISGAELRIGTTYDDPKAFDDTPLQDAKYDERCKQIALETLYVFANV